MAALEAATEMGRFDRRSALALDVRGTAELLMYELKAAQESFDAARRLQPEDSRSYLGLAACAAAEGRWRSAARAYERALLRECRDSASARTSLAFAALAAGDDEAALDHVRQARGSGPCGPLADQVTAMAHFALGRPGQAEMALRRSATGGVAPIEAVLSPLHVSPPDGAPPTALAREPRRMSEEYASAAAAMASSPHPPQADSDAPVAIVSPAEGAAVSGTVDVQVGGAARDRVRYVVLLLDGKFRAVRNVTPFRLSLDTMTCGDGAHALRVRGYDKRGSVLGADEVTVFVNNGARRTVAPAAADLRREVEQRLERCLALRPHPLNGPYLMGRILDRQNRLADALAAFEYVFSIQPMFRGVRRQLIDAYGRLGVLGGPDGARVIRQLPPGGRRVALTFDDGPGPAVTPWILDRLDEVGARATFFVVGKQAELYPHLVSEIRRRGHELACHSYSHTDLSELSIIEIERELVKTRAIARECTGDFLTYFRPPGGNYDMDVQRAVGEMGYATVFWTAAITDYPGMPPKRILELMTGKIDDGGIVLLHNGFDETVDVLPELLSFLKSKDYEFVTLSEGLGATAPSVQLAGGA
jgi:peptidoglycan/xylan/chitin deacetylase (PgdA/CDA1 family)